MLNNGNHRDAEGLWQLAESVAVADDQGKQANDAVTFLYSGGTVTLRLLTRHPESWRSNDDFYTLASKWKGNSLYYRPPFADFVELAAFEDGRFVNIGNGIKRIFEKIEPEAVVDWNRDILVPRALHDYAIQPDGSRRQGD